MEPYRRLAVDDSDMAVVDRAALPKSEPAASRRMQADPRSSSVQVDPGRGTLLILMK